jgi:hypothetical protein
VVIATFHNFHPRMVRRAIPDAWSFSTPQRVLEARAAVADSALRRSWADLIDSEELRVTADAAMHVAATLDGDGRPLFAAHADLPVPDAPHLKLWHACTLLREHRFDGHVAMLTGYGLTGLESLITAALEKNSSAEVIRQFRGWSDDEWKAGVERLQDHGVLDGSGALTDRGRQLRDAVERRTDDLAAQVWETLAESKREELLSRLQDLTLRLYADGAVAHNELLGLSPPS